MAAGVRGFGLFESLMQSVSEEDARDVVTLAAGDSLKLPRPFVFRVEPRDAAGRAAFGDSGRAVSVNACFGREYEASPAGPGIREVAYLGAAHLHVFLVDPSRDGRESHGHDGRVFAAAGKSITVPQYTVLQAAAELSRAVRERKPQRPQQCPLVVVVPRFDEWRESLADGISEGVMSAVRFGATGDGMQVVSRVSLCVRSYLEKLAPELVAIAEHNWSDVTYVPCTIFRASSFDAPSAMTPADSQSPLRSRPAADHLWCDVPLLIGLSKALGMPMEGSDNVQRRAARGQL